MVSENIWFEFLYVHDLEPRSRNDLDLQYSHTFMKAFSCLYLPTFRSQAAIISEKSTIFSFSFRKAKFDFAVKWVKVTPRSSFEQFMMNWSPRTTYQVSWKSACWFWRRRFLKVFYHIWAWRPSWSCDPDVANKILFPLPKEAPHKIWL